MTKNLPSKASSAPHCYLLGGSASARKERFLRDQLSERLTQSNQALEYAASTLAPKMEELMASMQILDEECHAHRAHEQDTQQLMVLFQDQLLAMEKHQHQAFQAFRQEMNDLFDTKVDTLLREQQLLKQQHDQILEHIQSRDEQVDLMDDQIRCFEQSMTDQVENYECGFLNQMSSLDRETQSLNSVTQTLKQELEALDEKVFALEKNQLKVQLALPSATGAQLLQGNSGNLTLTVPTNQISTMKDLATELATVVRDQKIQEGNNQRRLDTDRMEIQSVAKRLRDLQQEHVRVTQHWSNQWQALVQDHVHLMHTLPAQVERKLGRWQETLTMECYNLSRPYQVEKNRQSTTCAVVMELQHTSETLGRQMDTVLETLSRQDSWQDSIQLTVQTLETTMNTKFLQVLKLHERQTCPGDDDPGVVLAQ